MDAIALATAGPQGAATASEVRVVKRVPHLRRAQVGQKAGEGGDDDCASGRADCTADRASLPRITTTHSPSSDI